MTKFKSFINKIKEVYGEVYSNYKMTMILVDITTVLAIIYVIFTDANSKLSSESLIYRMVSWFLMFLAYVSAGSMGIESIRKRFFEKNEIVKKSVGMILIALLSAALTTLTKGWLFGCINVKTVFSVNDNRLISFYLAYFILIALSTFYQRYKESDFPIEKYFVHVFTQIIQIGIAWGILAVGFLLLSMAYETLIGVIMGGYLIPQILIIGLFVIPYFLMAITKVKDEVGKFFEVLIKYVMLIITIVGAAIIYLYIIKTIFVHIPSNEIFAITSALFFVAIPVGFACTAFDRDSFLQKIAYVLPYIYAPFIALQIYSIVVRVRQYGLTPSRYAGFVLIILEILYTLVYIFCRKYIDKLVLVMMVIAVAATLIPGVNAIDFSTFTQKNVIKHFVDSGMPTTEDGKTRLLGAYDFLCNESENVYLDGLLSQDDVDLIKEIDSKHSGSATVMYNLETESSIVPTDGFELVSEFNSVTYSNGIKMVDPTNVNLNVGGKIVGPFDLSEEIDSVIKRCKAADGSRISGPDVIRVSDDCELFINSVYISEDSGSGEILEFRIYGYILVMQEYWDGL